jgi:hypothetical protein
MADIYAKFGTATAVAQEDRFTPGGTIETNDNFTITLTGEDGSTAVITGVPGGTTVASVTAALLVAWNASTSPLKSGITASDQTTYFKLLGTVGVPFSAAATTTENGGGAADAQTFTRTATTACTGPNDWNSPLNWSGGAVPVSTDNVTFDGRNGGAVLYGLNQSAVTLATLNIKQANTYNVGTTTAALRVSATTCTIGEAATDGSASTGTALINIDFGTAQTTTRVANSKNIGTSGLEPVMLKGSHAANVVTVEGGVVGVATNIPGQTATVATLVVEAGTVKCGSGCTLTTITQMGGKLYVNSAVTTLTLNGGEVYTNGDWLLGTLTTTGGTAHLEHRRSGDEVTTLNLRGGTADFSDNTTAATVNALSFRSGTLVAPSGGLTLTGTTLDFNGNTELTLNSAA